MLTTFQKSVLVTLAASGLLVALVLTARGPAFAASAPQVNVVAGGQIAPGIVSTGDATVKIKPDIALVTVGAIAQGATAEDAQSAVADRVARILDKAKALGIAQKDVMSGGYHIDPQYAYGPNQAPRITGYQANQLIVLTLRDVNAAGKTLDALVQGDGANKVSIRFTLEDPKAAQANARSLAIADARSKADAMSGAAGVHLGRVIAVSDLGSPQPSAFARDEAVAQPAASVPTQIPVGDLEVIVHVQVQFEIQ